MTLLDLLQRVVDELPGCELTSVVSLETGLSLAAVSAAAPNDAAAADAFGGELYRVVREALTESGIDGAVDDIVVQGRARTLVSTPLADTNYFWHISTRVETTLGFTQAVMRKYQAEVAEGVTALVSSP